MDVDSGTKTRSLFAWLQLFAVLALSGSLCMLQKPLFGGAQFNSKHSQSLSLADVALFKGRGDVDPEELYDQPGIVHRSPRNINGDYRVVFVVDIPQEGMHY